MVRRVNQPVSVGLLIDEGHRLAAPKWVLWAGKKYAVQELGFHHRYREGRKTWHVWHVDVGMLDMRLELDSESLACVLKEVSDGLAD
jgi:hypothetical protein